jgi:hypothetical protein
MLCGFEICCAHPQAGFHWPRAVAHLFGVRVAVYIYRWEHAYVFGDPDDEMISVWKNDVETHFEPLIPLQCMNLLHQPPTRVLFTTVAVVTNVGVVIRLAQLEQNALWSAAFAELAPQPWCPAVGSCLPTLSFPNRSVAVPLPPLALEELHSVPACDGFLSAAAASVATSAPVAKSQKATAAITVAVSVATKSPVSRVRQTFATSAEAAMVVLSSSDEESYSILARRTRRRESFASSGTAAPVATSREASASSAAAALVATAAPVATRREASAASTAAALVATAAPVATSREASAASTAAALVATAAPVATSREASAASTASWRQVVSPGLLIKGTSSDQRRSLVISLLLESGHKVVVRNARPGYDYFVCKCCPATCSVSKNMGDGRSWYVSKCSDSAQKRCAMSLYAPMHPGVGSVHQPMIELPAIKQCVTCLSCMNHEVDSSKYVQCDKHHIVCSDCFDNYVNSQFINADNRLRFINSGGQIHCYRCTELQNASNFVYDMRLALCHLSPDVYAKYVQCSTEIAVIRVEQVLTKRLSEANDKIDKLQASDPDQVAIGTRLLHYFICTVNHNESCSSHRS